MDSCKRFRTSPLKLLNTPSTHYIKAADVSCINNQLYMLLDWQFDFWEKDKYMFNAMSKRQEKTRMCHAVGSSQWKSTQRCGFTCILGLSFSFWPQTGDCLSAVQRQALLVCKGRGVGTTGVRSLVQGNQVTVAAIAIRSVSQSDRAVTLPGSSLSPQAAWWGWPCLWVQEGFSRASLVKSWHPGYTRSTTHTLFISRLLCGTVLDNFH